LHPFNRVIVALTYWGFLNTKVVKKLSLKNSGQYGAWRVAQLDAVC